MQRLLEQALYSCRLQRPRQRPPAELLALGRRERLCHSRPERDSRHEPRPENLRLAMDSAAMDEGRRQHQQELHARMDRPPPLRRLPQGLRRLFRQIHQGYGRRGHHNPRRVAPERAAQLGKLRLDVYALCRRGRLRQRRPRPGAPRCRPRDENLSLRP